MTEHHICPRSRGGESIGSNVIMVEQRIHNAYHALFSNLTPAEIPVYLNECWFSGKATLTADEWKRLRKPNGVMLPEHLHAKLKEGGY